MRMRWNITASHVISLVLALAFVMQLASLWAALTHRHMKTPPPPSRPEDKSGAEAPHYGETIETGDAFIRHRGERPIIAYAVSVTKDGSYIDGAAVLARGLPVDIKEIHGEFLRSKIDHNGCCGAWELLKLYAWNLTEYHRVVHVDMDAFFLQSVDELYDDDSDLWAGGVVKVLYTYDWTMAHAPWGKNPPVQGGFFVAKPDPGTYEAMLDVVRQGDYRPGKGWGGTGAGTYYGGMTIQGLLPYFFETLWPGTGRAVDNCVYNNMANNPMTVSGFGKGDCRDGTKPPATCNDCRLVDVATVKSVHMTICGKPWSCSPAERLSCPYCPICAKFHKRWFDIRKELEVEWGTYDIVSYTGGASERHGMCSRQNKGSSGYQPIPIDLLLTNASRSSAWRASWRRQE